jgi:hypothetical protein
MRKTTYFSVTTRMRAQISSDDHAEHGGAQVAARRDDGVQGFAHGVKRAGADVAEDDADRGKGQLEAGLPNEFVRQRQVLSDS